MLGYHFLSSLHLNLNSTGFSYADIANGTGNAYLPGLVSQMHSWDYLSEEIHYSPVSFGFMYDNDSTSALPGPSEWRVNSLYRKTDVACCQWEYAVRREWISYFESWYKQLLLTGILVRLLATPAKRHAGGCSC